MTNIEYAFIKLTPNITKFLQTEKRRKKYRNHHSFLLIPSIKLEYEPKKDNRLVIYEKNSNYFYYFPTLDRLYKEGLERILNFSIIVNRKDTHAECYTQMTIPNLSVYYESKECYAFKVENFDLLLLTAKTRLKPIR